MAKKTLRYGVVGLGNVAQTAILPAFQHAKRNSRLTALVSGDQKKLKLLGKKYKVSRLCTYEEYDELLASGEVDAVYIALPNDQHRDFAVRAAKAGIHILSEKPLGISVAEGEVMLNAARSGGVKLMTAYRLHFEEANLKVIDLIKKTSWAISEFLTLYSPTRCARKISAHARSKKAEVLFLILGSIVLTPQGISFSRSRSKYTRWPLIAKKRDSEISLRQSV